MTPTREWWPGVRLLGRQQSHVRTPLALWSTDCLIHTYVRLLKCWKEVNTCSQQFLQGIISRILYYCGCVVQNSNQRRKIMLSLHSEFSLWEEISRLKTRGGFWGWQVGQPPQAPLLRGPRTSSLRSSLWVCQAIFSSKLEMLIHAPFKILLQGQIT